MDFLRSWGRSLPWLALLGCANLSGLSDVGDAGGRLDGTTSLDSGVLPHMDAGHDSERGKPLDSGATEGGNSACAGDASVLGCPCGAAGALACNGVAQKVSMICMGGVWTFRSECPTGENCDTAAGASHGACLPVADACANAAPDQVLCSGPTTRVQCGIDLVSTTPQPPCVDQACQDGGCVGACAPGTTQCASTNVEECGATGQWGDAAACTTVDAAASSDAGGVSLSCCGTGCINVADDPANCGGCGVTCAGTCALSRCTSLVVASTDISVFTADDTNVYWASGDGYALYEKPIVGGSVTTLMPSSVGLSFPPIEQLAVLGPNVYWRGPSGVYSLPVSGAGSLPASVGGTEGVLINSLVADSTAVFWATGPGAVVEFVPGGDGGTTTTLTTSATAPTNLVLTATNVFYADTNADDVATLDRLDRSATSPAPPVVLITAQEIYFVSVSGTSLYWTDASGNIYATPTSGAGDGGSTLVATLSDITGLVATTSNLYVGLFNGGSIARLPTTMGGSITTLVASGAQDEEFLLTSSRLLWSGFGAAGFGLYSQPLP